MSQTYRSSRPSSTEYAPYYEKYIGAVKVGDILVTLSDQIKDSIGLISKLTEEQAMFCYAPGKWNIKEVVGHVIDCERVFAYRALRIARNDKTPLASIDENNFALYGGHAKRTIPDLLDEFENLRISTLDLLKSFDEEAWLRTGTASNNNVSVRGLAWIIAGHERHHIAIIRERYLQIK